MTAIERNTTPPRAESAGHPESAPSEPRNLRSRAPDVGDAFAGALGAIQGELGSFSHQAALQALGADTRIVPCKSFDELFAAVESGQATHGVAPVENTLAGSVTENLDLLTACPLHVTGETAVRVELCVVGPPGASVATASRAASHPVALRQCRSFFRDHPWLEPVPVWDTAGSVRDLLAGEAAYDLAIGSELAADLYGGEVLVGSVEDDRANFTRFYVVETPPSPPVDGPVRATLAFVVVHRPGSLHRALGALADEGLDLTRLESRPIPGRPWEYRFHADAQAPDPDVLARGLERLREVTAELRVFGSWAAARDTRTPPEPPPNPTPLAVRRRGKKS